jgi:hypothetical protein
MSDEKDISPEENVITPEEFEAIEKKEGRKPPRIEEKKEKEVKMKGASDIEKLILKTEKLEGKFDAMAAERQALSDRISVLNEEIGEIRSSVLGRDRTFSDIQSEFKEMKDAVKEISPRSIAANLERGVQGIEVNAVKIEGLEARTKELSKELKNIKTTLFKIRDVQNLVEIIEGLKKKIDVVEKDRKYTSRLAGKIEAMFAEMSEKLGEVDRFKDKITLNEDAMHELMKTVDMIDIKLDQMVKKDDVKMVEDEFAKKIEATRMEWDDKIYDVKKIVDELLESLKNAGVKGMLEKVGKLKLKSAFATRNELTDIKRRLDDLRSLSDEIKDLKMRQFIAAEKPSVEPVAKTGRRPIPKAPAREELKPAQEDAEEAGPRAAPSPPQQEVPQEVKEGMESVGMVAEKLISIIEQAGEAVKAGQTEIARSKYLEALSLYNQLSQAATPEEAEELYERIRKLYNRLRIYG